MRSSPWRSIAGSRVPRWSMRLRTTSIDWPRMSFCGIRLVGVRHFHDRCARCPGSSRSYARAADRKDTARRLAVQTATAILRFGIACGSRICERNGIGRSAAARNSRCAPCAARPGCRPIRDSRRSFCTWSSSTSSSNCEPPCRSRPSATVLVGSNAGNLRQRRNPAAHSAAR